MPSIEMTTSHDSSLCLSHEISLFFPKFIFHFHFSFFLIQIFYSKFLYFHKFHFQIPNHQIISTKIKNIQDNPRPCVSPNAREGDGSSKTTKNMYRQVNKPCGSRTAEAWMITIHDNTQTMQSLYVLFFCLCVFCCFGCLFLCFCCCAWFIVLGCLAWFWDVGRGVYCCFAWGFCLSYGFVERVF